LDNDVEISLTTRESEVFRSNMVSLGVTAMSAGSKTEPGGYTKKEELEQFATNDNRNPKQLSEMVRQHGYEAVWKDWDNFG
jgi:2-iminoacetate synthase